MVQQPRGRAGKRDLFSRGKTSRKNVVEKMEGGSTRTLGNTIQLEKRACRRVAMETIFGEFREKTY